ncbi:signal recognition particle protein [Candidatus Dependentiae bacterium]|nr:MAG: signal recognition particle protein [Candidatus Dependentiae bacterium]
MFNFLSDRFSGIFDWLNGKSRITESDIDQAFEQLFDALIDADVPQDLAKTFLTSVTKSLKGHDVQKNIKPGHYVIKVVQEKLTAFLGAKDTESFWRIQYPSTMMVLGLQGSGKTTTTVKIAYAIKERKSEKGKSKRIMVASVDYYRPAAIDQLEILAQENGIGFYRAEAGNPLDAATEIMEHARKQGYDLLIIDTAGRLHVDETMMQELKDIDKIVRPEKKILILDAMTGQESLSVAQSFSTSIGFEGAVLTKMDSQTRAGAAFSFYYALKKPVFFLGVGEKVDDIEPFLPERIASRIIGMGDFATLIEKAEKQFDSQTKVKQEDSSRRFMSGSFTLDDFLQQLGYLQKLGSLQKIASYLPGMGSMTPEMVEKGERELKKTRAIISSMTAVERVNVGLLNGERKRRIAKGSGTTATEINQMLQKFEQIKQYAKLMKNNSQFKSFFKR